jgi:hypothetical protein
MGDISTSLPITPMQPSLNRPTSSECSPVQHPNLTLYVGPTESPSLNPKKSGLPAYEFKYLLSETQAQEVEERLAARMTLDPNAAADGGYHITTLYCDTPDFDVFYRHGRHRLSKFRIRRYGESARIFLERKSKWKQEVRKRRTSIDVDRLDDLADVLFGDNPEALMYGQQLRRIGAQPVVLIEYDRVAYFAPGIHGALRLTFDRHIQGGATQAWSLNRSQPGYEPLPDRVVCEFKFRGAMPPLFKSVVQEMKLAACGVSKYRLCVQALKLADPTNKGNSSHA